MSNARAAAETSNGIESFFSPGPKAIKQEGDLRAALIRPSIEVVRRVAVSGDRHAIPPVLVVQRGGLSGCVP